MQETDSVVSKKYFLVIQTSDDTIFDQVSLAINKIVADHYRTLSFFLMDGAMLATEWTSFVQSSPLTTDVFCLINKNNFSDPKLLESIDGYKVQIDTNLVSSIDPGEQPQRICYNSDAQSLAEICLVCIENTLEHFDRTFTPIDIESIGTLEDL